MDETLRKNMDKVKHGQMDIEKTEAEIKRLMAAQKILNLDRFDLTLMKRSKDSDILTIGNSDKKPTYGAFAQRVEILPWLSSKHNMGMSMNREVWDKLKACAREFCTFDDHAATQFIPCASTGSTS